MKIRKGYPGNHKEGKYIYSPVLYLQKQTPHVSRPLHFKCRVAQGSSITWNQLQDMSLMKERVKTTLCLYTVCAHGVSVGCTRKRQPWPCLHRTNRPRPFVLRGFNHGQISHFIISGGVCAPVRTMNLPGASRGSQLSRPLWENGPKSALLLEWTDGWMHL